MSYLSVSSLGQGMVVHLLLPASLCETTLLMPMTIITRVWTGRNTLELA
jgi:hypothetical protein